MPEREIGYSVKLVFLVLVLVIVILGITFWGIPEKFKNLFPDFGRGDVSVKWDEDIFLEHPEMIVFQYNDGTLRGDGWGVGDIRYRCNDEWEFYAEDKEFFRRDARGDIKFREDSSSWLSVKGAEDWYKFFKYGDEDKEFILNLMGKSCENGLMMLVERMLEDDASLTVRIGLWANNYDRKDKIAKNLDMLIDKFNQISRGGIKDG